jgi:glutamate carboxypeptidase
MQSLSINERAVLAHIDQANMLDQVQNWSSINTGSANLAGLAQMADTLAAAFAGLPGDLTLVDGASTERVNADGSISEIMQGKHLVLTVRPTAPTQLLFTGHMDTVFAVDHPFQAQKWLEPGILNGPGVADMKGGISVMLAALSAAETDPGFSRVGYQVLINSDEEVGSPSSAPLIAHMANGKLAALTYEPALPDGTLAGARAGSGNFSMIITGKSAHAGRNPAEGRNAVLAAADLALQLKALTCDGLSVNPARIEGGSPNNVVPDHAVLRVNLRPHTPNMETYSYAQIKALIHAIQNEHEVSIHLHGSYGRPPKPIDAQAEKLFGLVKQCGADLGLNISWKSTGGVCDGNNIAACGVPVVDTMGVRGGSIHSADEFLIVDSLTERAQLSALTLLRIAAKGSL